MARKGFISITHVLQAISKNTGQRNTLSVPNASAQISDLCNAETTIHQIHKHYISAVARWKISHPILAVFAQLQFETGARVSEILQIHSSHISPSGRIHLSALKKGRDRIILPVANIEWIKAQRHKERFIFSDLNRFEIHRRYVEQGISAQFGNNTKRSTTHLFRHLVGLDLSKMVNPLNSTSIALGQKTESAADHYQAPIRRKGN